MGSAAGPNQATLNRVRLQASIDEATSDSKKLATAALHLKDAAEFLKTIAVDVGWTGVSAENSAETFNALGLKVLAHSDNLGALQAVAVRAEALVDAGRTDADTVADLLDTADVLQPMVDALVPVKEIRDADAFKKLQALNASAMVLQLDAQAINITAQENRVDPDALLPEPVPVPGPDDEDPSGGGPSGDGYSQGGPSGGSTTPSYGSQPAGLYGTGVSGPVGTSGESSSGTGTGTGTGSSGGSWTGGSTWGGGHGSGSAGGATGGHGGSTSVDGATGGYVNGAGGYGGLDRTGAAGFGGGGPSGSIGAGGSTGPGSSGATAGMFGAGSAGLLGGAGAAGGGRSGLFGGGSGAGGRGAGASVPGAPGAGGTAGGRGGAMPGTAAGAAGTSGTSGTTGGMMGGGGAGGAGGGSKKGKRTSSTYLAPRLDDEPSAPGRVSAMRAGSRAQLAANPPPPERPEPADDEW